jgi:hypothetical protein
VFASALISRRKFVDIILAVVHTAVFFAVKIVVRFAVFVAVNVAVCVSADNFVDVDVRVSVNISSPIVMTGCNISSYMFSYLAYNSSVLLLL